MPQTEASILLRGFAVDANIGVHEFERAGPQRLSIDIELHLASATRPETDAIDQVLNYDFLRSKTLALLALRHYELQETLAHDIASFCLAEPQVAAVTINTRKPDVYPDCESVGYRLYVRR
ncbi:dihydroneopterin aldolase [Acidocella sp.]|uniref:dihydroneopterin aldolase n=1 Tax=Acidocella sp. TaxID=50710 RepID=UPI0026066168|nr:dihydroneopterin aldolase [Acidocella sp.]